MPIFTVEATYRLPVYRHQTYVARDVEHACQQAIADDEWENEKLDYETSGSTYITGVWRGADSAYHTKEELVPEAYASEDTAILSTHHLLTIVNSAIDAWPQFDTDDEVSGANLVHWFATWRASAKQAVEQAERHIALQRIRDRSTPS